LRKDERLQKFQTSVEFSEEHDGKPISDEELSEYLRTPAIPQRALVLREFKEALNALPADERKAVILCHIMGYDQESDDPEKITAATICGVRGRTIRNRLTRAAARLSPFKELIQ
jgi:DNA-directed RNA polymerase specialized sigma24 family protein